MGPSSANSDPNDLGPCYEALEFSSWFRHPIPYSRSLLVLLPLFACLEGCLKKGGQDPWLVAAPNIPFWHLSPLPFGYRKAYSSVLTSHLPRPSQPEDYTSSLHWGLPSLPWQLSPQETQVGDQNFCVPPPPQPVPKSWSLLSVSKLLSTGAHGADWGWMPTAVTPRTAEGQTQGQLSGHTLTAGGSWSCMGVGDCGAHCHIRKPAQRSSLEASPAPPTWAFPPAG